MALVVERSVHGRDDSEAADDGYSIQEAAQLPFNVTTPNVRVDTFVGCLPSKPAHDNEVDISKCIDLVHELRTGPKSLSQNTYSNDRRSTGRIVPYRWTWRDCRIMLLPAERDKPRSERFSEYQIAEHAAKIIKKCLIEIPGPAIGGLVNVLASPLETESHFTSDSTLRITVCQFYLLRTFRPNKVLPGDMRIHPIDLCSHRPFRLTRWRFCRQMKDT